MRTFSLFLIVFLAVVFAGGPSVFAQAADTASKPAPVPLPRPGGEKLIPELQMQALPRSQAADESARLDVVHDAVLRIVRTVRPVAGGEKQLIAWMRLVVQSVAYDHLRREHRRAAREQALQPPTDVAHVNGVDLSERAEWLRIELTKLDPRLVKLIELRYTQRWTLEAIGQRLGLSASSVDGRIRRALDRMRDRAREVFDEP